MLVLSLGMLCSLGWLSSVEDVICFKYCMLFVETVDGNRCVEGLASELDEVFCFLACYQETNRTS